MEKNKQIIVGAVGCVIAAILVFYFSSMSAKPSESNQPFSGLDFYSPKLDEKKFDFSNKKELYDDSKNFDQSKYDTIAVDLSFLQMKRKKSVAKKKSRYKRKEETSLKQTKQKQKIDEEMQMLMDLQNQLNDANSKAKGVPEQQVEKTPILQASNYFYGAVSNNKTTRENLIPAEIIDQGILKQGSTVAIRTKQPITVKEQNIRIPKGAVMYANVGFEETRLILNITCYRRDNKLYPIKINVHDFDGRIGIHLKQRSIFNIPLNVSKDAYDAAVKTYEQQNPFGGNEPVPLEQIALLSAGKEVSKEIFERRRVFVPRKYHLWLTIKTDDEQ